MNIAHRKLLIAAFALFCSAAATANDAPKPEPAKDAKADAPAEPELPSRPYPTNAAPKAFQPKKDAAPKANAAPNKPAEKAAEKSADKPGDKAAAKSSSDKPADKSAADAPADKHGADKPADAHATAGPKHESKPHKTSKKHRAAGNPQAKQPPLPVSPELVALARELLAKEKNANPKSYVVKARDNLDSVIRKTIPTNLFAPGVLRQAFVRANPSLLTSAKVKLSPGQVLRIPDVGTIRAVVMSEGGNSAEIDDSKISLHSTAPVLAPTIAANANELNPPIAIPRLPVNVPVSANPAPEVAPKEKRKWVHYP